MAEGGGFVAATDNYLLSHCFIWKKCYSIGRWFDPNRRSQLSKNKKFNLIFVRKRGQNQDSGTSPFLPFFIHPTHNQTAACSASQLCG